MTNGTPARDRMLGQTLGHYRIVEKIGAGGMGDVYLAHDERLDRDVALKVLRAGAVTDEATRRRFRKEALALSKLNHPNIATVFDFDTQEGVDFLVMEYVAGERLGERVGSVPLTVKEVERLGIQLADGLDGAHAQGIVHRDLKPGNIRLTSDGRLKILDFGLAKLLRQPTSETATTEAMTEFHGPVGTLPYTAPEQLRGDAVDTRTDIWAAGAVLYEMVTGRRAFPGAESARLITAILTEQPPLPSAVNHRVSQGLESVIAKCLEKDPERRYQSARELAVDLRRLESPSSGRVVVDAWPRRRRRRIAAWIGSGLVASVILILALNLGSLRERLFAESTRIDSLAVLPLRNLSGDPQQEYFADGMTDALINDLCKVAALRVISITSVMPYRNSKKSLTEIARELNVDAVVEGSVLRLGQQVRVNAQLIRPGRERGIWAESYERGLSDVMNLQSEVAQRISEAIQIKLTPDDRTRLARSRLVNPQAYDAYLQGRSFDADFAENMDLERARRAYLKAIQIDPQFAPAYAALAACYANMSLFSAMRPAEAAPLGLEAAMRAIELDPNLDSAQSSLGYVRLNLMWDWPGAEVAYKRAHELNPSLPETDRFLLTCLGRTSEAVAISEARARDEPNSMDAMLNLAWDLFYARRYDEAIHWTLKVLERDPQSFNSRIWLAMSYAFKGDHRKAVEECDALENAEEKTEGWDGTIGSIYAISGRRDKALQVLDRLREREKHGYVDPCMIAYIYAGLGENDQALEYLEKAVDVRSANALQMNIEPVFDGLRSDPRYAELLQIVGPPGAKPDG